MDSRKSSLIESVEKIDKEIRSVKEEYQSRIKLLFEEKHQILSELRKLGNWCGECMRNGRYKPVYGGRMDCESCAEEMRG